MDFLAAPHVEAIPLTTPFIGPEQLLRESGCGRLVRLGANESAFGPSPKAVAAMAAELPHLAWYGDPESYDLRGALARKHGCTIDNVSVMSGIDDLMGNAVRAFLAPGQIALATRGTYPTFAFHVTGFGGSLETVDYRADGFVDSAALLERARELRPAIVYLANPDNPSGTLLPAAQIDALAKGLPKETLFFLDEAYADFVDPSEVLETDIAPNVIRARTFSKAYGMAGARVGYAIASARIVQTFQKIRLHYGVNRNAQIGALASLDDAAFHAEVVAAVARGREDYYALARSLGRGFIESRTNFVCIDFGSAAAAGSVVAALLQRGVFIRKPGAPPLDGHVRISVGTPQERDVLAKELTAVAAEAAPA